MVIAKQTHNAISSQLHAPGFVEALGIGRNAISVAEEGDVQRAAKDTFIGSEPLKSLFAAMVSAMSDTEPSEGHTPAGFTPKTLS